MRRHRRADALGIGLLTMTLLACAPQEEQQTEPDTDPAAASAETDDDTPTTLPPEFLECGDPDSIDADDGLMLASLDLTGAQWSTPEGFTETFAYYEDNPVENLVDLWVAEPEEDPVLLNVVNVAIYDGLDWGDAADGCGRVPLEAVTDRLESYREEIEADELSEAEMTHLAGHPAITQSVSLTEYDYIGYWLFSDDQLLHLYCQWTTEQEVIEAACTDLADSLHVD